MKESTRYHSLFVLLFVAGALYSRVESQWSTNPSVNSPVCTAVNDQTNPKSVSDGAGGAIIAWTDQRHGDYGDVYAQRISAAGVTLWASSGVPIRVEPNGQFVQNIVSDGAGGAIIVWMDNNVKPFDIYAQRIDGNGNTLWNPNGVVVSNAAGFLQFPAAAEDGLGGAIIAWENASNGHLYAQHFTSSGDTLWRANGTVVCNATGAVNTAAITADGSGGAIIAWADSRNGVDHDIYAQLLYANGFAAWTTNGVPIAAITGQQISPAVVSDNTGGAIISWQDSRNGDFLVYAQRIGPYGNVKWTTNGVVVYDQPVQNQYVPIVSDDAGGAILSWETLSGDIFAQRIGTDSTRLWQSNGQPICTAANRQGQVALVKDGVGGAIATWEDERSSDGIYPDTSDIYAQRINAAGTAQWISKGIAICSAANNQYSPFIIRDGSGGTIIAWSDYRSGFSDIYAQNVDPGGHLGAPPRIVKVRDVSNDQGGNVSVMWDPSYLDTWPNQIITSYLLFRGVKSSGVPGAAHVLNSDQFMKEVSSVAVDLGGTYMVPAQSSANSESIYWELLSYISAYQLSGYSATASTLSDSGPQGIPWRYFMVVARTNDNNVYWQSQPDSGYSTDNLPPAALGGGTISSSPQGIISLAWNKDRVDPDVGYYAVYRSLTSGFTLSNEARLKTTIDTTFVDSTSLGGQVYYYRVTVVDIHGNEGPPSAELSATALAVEMTSFSAAANGLAAELHWSTATETNSYGFEIERRLVVLTGTAISPWQKIGFVQGSGTSASQREYEFVDRGLMAGRYAYRIKLVDKDGIVKYSAAIELEVGLAPKEFTLSQNYPNPFNPSTTIQFTLAEDSKTSLKVYNMLGQEVSTLFDGEAQAGRIQLVKFDASRLPSGLYVAKLEAGKQQMIRKMMLVK